MPAKSSSGAALRSGETRGPKGRAGDIAAPILSTEALDDRIAIVGTAGSGKTYAAKGFVERLLEVGARVAIVDLPSVNASALSQRTCPASGKSEAG